MWLSYLLYLKRKGPIRTNLTCFTFVLTNFTGGGYKLNFFFKFEKLHVVLRLSLIYIPLSKYFYEERKVKKKIKTFDFGFAMYLPFARGLLILVIVLGQEVFARPATGKFRFISK